jgi:ribonuclease HII
MPSFNLECQFQGPVGGVDEVGRGPWAGPVVAAVAVFLDFPSLPHFLRDNIQDSKKLTKQKRTAIYEELKTLKNFTYGLGVSTVEEIDQMNISKATFLAMKRAIQSLTQPPQTLLIDGKTVPRFEGFQIHPVIKGDSISFSIAAASILAKVTRDSMMENLALDYPHYGWERNAGYGTAEHQKALALHGVSLHHRKSFAPIRALLNPHG